MGDAAQGEPRKHEVFEKPLKVEPEFEFWKTPRSYRRYPGGDELPDKVKVWRIQDTGKSYGGVVARAWGFEDSPDAEVLTAGYNTGKENGGVGVGRHGNFLQWGFSAAPSKMTDAGKNFFVNCVCYIAKFDGKAPLARTKTGHRTYAIRDAMILAQAEGESFALKSFPPNVVEKFKGDRNALRKYYLDHYELIYRDRLYRVDEELKSLGIESNRKVSTLERLIALLNDEEHAVTARLLLGRYTEESFEKPDEWEAWLTKNRGRIYFTDVGGYKFRVVPEGYLRTN
jgi:hypothetical protein